MPTYAFKCARCGPVDLHLSPEEVSEPRTCECGEPLKRVWTAPAPKVQRGLQDMDAGERQWHLDNKAWVESEAAKGDVDVKVQGPLELRPKLPSRHFSAG